VRSNDLLAISFLDEPQLNQQVRVDWRGRIELSWLADKEKAVALDVAGKTPSEIASDINSLAARNRILNTPRAAVLVMEFAEQSFVIQGQVSQPGRYLFPKGYSPSLPLPEAVALAGGYTRLASTQRVLVRRGAQVHKLDLGRMLSRPSEMFLVYPGDLITVPERIF
jgi:protein involved in polysaccharide export with SLBB domain